jgi:hypothetical protein
MYESEQESNIVVNDITSVRTKTDVNFEHYDIPYKGFINNKFYKFVSIDNYGSGQQGSKIRHAESGQIYKYLVGSTDEALLFKVADATGRNKRKERLALYYDSPEQFEKHHFITLNQNIKDKWYEKNRKRYI